jgi:hypothetical protein
MGNGNYCSLPYDGYRNKSTKSTDISLLISVNHFCS